MNVLLFSKKNLRDGRPGKLCPTPPRHPDYVLKERRDGTPEGTPDHLAVNCLEVKY